MEVVSEVIAINTSITLLDLPKIIAELHWITLKSNWSRWATVEDDNQIHQRKSSTFHFSNDDENRLEKVGADDDEPVVSNFLDNVLRLETVPTLYRKDNLTAHQQWPQRVVISAREHKKVH